jgi:subtilisin family serine protease
MKNLFILVLIVVISSIPASGLDAAPRQREPAAPKTAHPTRLVAKYAPGAPAHAAAQAIARQGMKVRKHIKLVPGLVVLDDELPAGALKGEARRQAQHDRVKALRESGLFEYIEPDYKVTVNLQPNDTAFTDGTLWGLPRIDTERAWNITTGSPDVLVAVIDTGIRYTHQDLAQQMWHNPGELPNNGIDDDGDGYVDNVYGINSITGSGDPMDDHYHGTHVAGTIGAAANNGGPTVGVAWQVRLMACKFLDNSGSGYTSDAIDCINFAVSKGARVLNNSWGGGGYSQALLDAINAAGRAGVLFVAAAGNASDDTDFSPHYPSSYETENIVSVAALAADDTLAEFSNFGRSTVHLGAPGIGIYSCGAADDSNYRVLSGTSMAAPHVSGVAALVLSQYPGITMFELKARLLNTVLPMAALSERCVSGGRVNAYQALTAVPDGTPEISVVTSPRPPLLAGSEVNFYVTVSDLAPVTDASISGLVAGGGPLYFANNGVPPDATGADPQYTTTLPVPATGSSMTVQLTVSAPGKGTVTTNVTFAIRVPPANDLFANRLALSGAYLTTPGSNLDAAKESLEPDHGGNQGGKSVWWQWTAPTSGLVSITTVGSTFDTLLGVYTGSAVNGLTAVASNDDSFGLSSAVVIMAVAGTSYAIAVDGYSAASGSIQLNIFPGDAFAPINDRFAERIGIPVSTTTISGGNSHATSESGEPHHGGNEGGKSVWWKWTARANGTANISTLGSSFDTLLAVYTGSVVDSLTLIAGNDDTTDNLQSAVTFPVVAGTTYQIAVDGYRVRGAETDEGTIQLHIHGPTPPPPANDLFANRQTIPNSTSAVTGSNESASKEASEPEHAGNAGGKSVWWTWTAAENGLMRMTTRGSSFDTLLAVYTGTAINGLSLVASNDDDGEGLSSAVTISATEGVTYHIAVDGYAASMGDIQLNLYPIAPLHLLPPQRLANGLRIWLRSSDGRALDRSRLPHIDIYVSRDASQWTPLTAPFSALDGMLFIDDPGANSFPVSLYRAVEQAE